MSSAEQSQGLQIQASRLPSPLFALLSKRKYFEHFMGTWGGEEGSGRGFIQEKQPPRRILPRKPKGGGQEGSPLSMAKEEPEGTQEPGGKPTHCAWWKGPLSPEVSPDHEPRQPLSPAHQGLLSCCCCCLCCRGHPRIPSSPIHSH